MTIISIGASTRNRYLEQFRDKDEDSFDELGLDEERSVIEAKLRKAARLFFPSPFFFRRLAGRGKESVSWR